MSAENLILKEMELVSQKINHFDTLRHNTKQLTITLWLATVGVGFSIISPHLIVLATLIPIPFWYFDATYHAYQEGFNARLRAIQNYLRGEPFEHSQNFPIPDFYGIFTIEKSKHKAMTSVHKNFWKPKLLLFYGSLIVFSLLAYLITNSVPTKKSYILVGSNCIQGVSIC